MTNLPQTDKVKFLDMLMLGSYCAFMYWLSAQASLKPPIDFGILYQDKLYHAGAYFIMSLLAWRSFKHYCHQSFTLALVSIAFCSLYGVSDEWHQSFVAGRSSDAFDWLADTVGASLAMVFLSQPIFGVNKKITV
jgi:VanZ family protein